MKLFLLSFLLLLSGQSRARDFFFEFDQSLSYTGINLHVLAGTDFAKFEVYAGPKFIISDQYLITDQAYSINLGTRYNVLESEKWKAFFNLDFNMTWMKAYDRIVKSSDTYNTLMEIYLGYGLSYRINDSFSVGNVMGYGKYMEKFNNLAQDTTEEYSGLTGIIKFIIRYDY
jgi:hypothetical protein